MVRMRRQAVYCFFCVNHEIDEIWQQVSRTGVVRMGQNLFGRLIQGAVLYITAKIGELWPRGARWGAKILV